MKTLSEYSVHSLRAAGLSAKWGKTRSGAPRIFAQDPNGNPHQRDHWWVVGGDMLERAKLVGWHQAFHEHTVLGDIFSIPA